jgi:outer membrane lipoprotein-sorting protein
MKTIITAGLLALCITLAAQSTFAETAAEIVKRMDMLMNPDCAAVFVLEFREKGKLTEDYKMIVKAKDNNQKVIVRFVSPARQVGNDLIMLDRNVWSYDKKSGRIIKIPSNQAFGATDFSYGDVVRLNMTDNYRGEIVKEDGKTLTLKLSAIERDTPYAAIEVIVDKQGSYPLEVKCYAKNDKLIKTIRYADVKQINGRTKPTKLTVISVYEPDNTSVMKLLQETPKQYPDHIFNKRVLETRQDENL